MTQKSVCQGEHNLVLRAAEGEGKVSAVEISYSEPGRSFGSGRQRIPGFNDDRLYFTPAFLLGCDKKYYLQNQTFQRFQFKEKIERNLVSEGDRRPGKLQEIINVAAPNNSYCQICKQTYESYFLHTALASHRQTANNNPINIDIQELCQQVSEGTHSTRGKLKSRGIKKLAKSQKVDCNPERKLWKQEDVNLGCEYFPKSANQSTNIGQKEQSFGGQ